jgi:hypothetical protein
MMQHADDWTNFIQDKSSYDDLIKEFEQCEKVSGSKINTDKTEFFLIGNWRGKKHGLPTPLIKDNAKTLGINFGEKRDGKKQRKSEKIYKKICKSGH